MAIGKMYSGSPKEYEQIKEFMYHYRIENIEQQVKVVRDIPRFSYSDVYKYGDTSFNYNETHMTYFKMEVPERELVNFVGKLNLFDNLMQEPETRQLVNEAIFIYRLKHGSTF